MRLESRDGAWVDLSVLRRQRTEQRGRRPEQDWATDWLVLRGEVCLPGELRWTFREPCLTPWEARRLLRVHVTGAAAPVDPGTGRLLTGGIALDVDAPALGRAAAAWSADLDAVAP